MTSTRKSALIPSDHLRPVIRLVRRTVRYGWIGLATFGIVAAAALAVALLRPKQYRSEAAVYYREGLQWSSNEAMSTRRVGQRLKDMLLARARLQKVIEELKLYPELVSRDRTAEAVEEMRLATSFKFDQSDIFVISYTGRSPQEAQRVTARLSEALIDENTRLRSQQAEVAREFLDAEKKRKGDELAAKEAEQLRFLAKHPEFAQEQSTTMGVTLRARPRRGSDAAAVLSGRDDTVLGALRREEVRLRRQISSPGQIPPAPPDPALSAAKDEAEAKVAAAKRELADRQARFTERHPDVRLAEAMVAEAEGALVRALEALAVAQRPIPLATLQQRLARVQQDVATYRREHPQTSEVKSDLADVNSDAAKRIVAVESEWARLTRDVAEARERLQALDTQQFMASMTASMLTSGQTAQIIVVDPAFLPAQPIGLSTKKLFLAGVAMALLLGIGVAVLLSVVDDLLYDKDDVERLELAPVLAEVDTKSLQLPRGHGVAQARRGRGRGDPADADRRLTTVQRDIVRRIARSTPRRILPADTTAAARPGAEPTRAIVASPVPAPQAVASQGAPRDSESITRQAAAALLAQRAEPSEALALDTTPFHMVSDSPDLVRIHRVAPAERLDPRLLMLAAPDSPAAASFRVLRHRLAQRSDVKVILVTSPRAGEGKTLTAVNLALALGEAGRARVILLEANLRSPSIARLFGFLPPVCLSQQLELHHARPTEPWVVVECVAPWMHVAAIAPEGEKRPLRDGRVLELCIEEMREAGYDYIIVDGPAVLDSADVNLVEESVDGILMALRARSSHAQAFRKATEQVGSGKLIGTVLLGA